MQFLGACGSFSNWQIELTFIAFANWPNTVILKFSVIILIFFNLPMFQCNTHTLLDTQILCIARNPFKMCSTLSNFSMYSLTSSLCCLFRSDLKKIKVFQLTNKLAAPLSCFAPLVREDMRGGKWKMGMHCMCFLWKREGALLFNIYLKFSSAVITIHNLTFESWKKRLENSLDFY